MGELHEPKQATQQLVLSPARALRGSQGREDILHPANLVQTWVPEAGGASQTYKGSHSVPREMLGTRRGRVTWHALQLGANSK